MVLQVKPTPTRFPTSSLYTPMDKTPLQSISSMCHPWGEPTGTEKEPPQDNASCLLAVRVKCTTVVHDLAV